MSLFFFIYLYPNKLLLEKLLIMNRIYYLFVFAFLFSMNAYSQDKTSTAQQNEEVKKENVTAIDKSNYNSWAITLGAGNYYFTGDLFSFGAEDKSFDIGFNLGVSKMFSASMGVEASFMMANANFYPNSFGLNNNDLNGHTETTFYSGNISLVINLTNLIITGRDNAERKWNVNAYPGLGISLHGAKYYDKSGSIVADYSSDQLTRVYSVPVALGLKYRLSKNFDIELRETSTFYNDSNFDGRALADGTSDQSFYTSLSLVWKLGSKERHLDWSNPLDDAYSDVNKLQSQVDGMSTDTDGDGVPDSYDVDNETPTGVMVAGNGKALDSDQDGIPDYKDVDPFTPLGAAVDEYGNEKDSDKDGIGDSSDKEPNSKEGAIVNWQGITVSGASGGIISELIPSVFFKFDSDKLEKGSADKLVVIAKILHNYSDMSVDVVGYADQVGNADYNQKLGERRAQAVVDFLVNTYGVDKSRLNVKTAGADQPLSSSKTYYKNNRRVDFIINQ